MVEKKVSVWWLPVCLILGVTGTFVYVTLSARVRPAPIIIEPPPPTPLPSPTPTPRPIRVYVSGEVTASAVYELPADSIVADAVEAAGDFTEEAAADLVNLAQPLADGMHIHIPDAGELAATGERPIVSAPEGGAAASLDADRDGEVVNINTASLEELDTLPGVGPATAQKILDYREDNGPFEEIEQIMEVSGIGEAKFEQMEELITVE